MKESLQQDARNERNDQSILNLPGRPVTCTAAVRQSTRAANLVENRPPAPHTTPMQSVFSGPVYVVRDNIDTDQIIPAQYLNLVPTLPEEY